MISSRAWLLISLPGILALHCLAPPSRGEEIDRDELARREQVPTSVTRFMPSDPPPNNSGSCRFLGSSRGMLLFRGWHYNGQSRLVLVDPATDQPVWDEMFFNGIEQVAVNPREHLACVLSSTCGIFSLETGKQVVSLGTEPDFHPPAWSPDGRFLLFLARDRRHMQVHDHSTGDVERLGPKLRTQVLGFDWSPDSRLLAVQGQGLFGNEKVHILDAAPGSASHGEVVRTLDVSGPARWANDRILVTVESDLAQVLDAQSGEEIGEGRRSSGEDWRWRSASGAQDADFEKVFGAPTPHEVRSRLRKPFYRSPTSTLFYRPIDDELVLFEETYGATWKVIGDRKGEARLVIPVRSVEPVHFVNSDKVEHVLRDGPNVKVYFQSGKVACFTL